MSFPGKRYVWWIGVPLVSALLVWLPYIFLNLWARVDWSPWRIPFVPIVLFDSSAYFQWIGPALYGYPAGNHIRSFAWILRGFGSFLPHSWSIAEIWLFTLWLSVVIGVWVMALAIERWSGLSKFYSRIFACLLSVLLVIPFMGRPGVFTWYAPFYSFGLIAILCVNSALSAKKYLKAVIWSLSALAAAWAYPYFLVHIVLWLVGIWFVFLFARYRILLMGMSLLGIVCLPFLVWVLTPSLVRSSAPLAFEIQARMGLAFTRLPVLSNSFILVFLWAFFLVALAYARSKYSHHNERLYLLCVGWITLLFAWLSNVFTGIYIHNDHFRGPAVFLAWMSLTVVYGMVEQEKEKRKWFVLVVLSIVTVSLVACFWYLFGKYFVFRGDYLNVVHVTHWLALTIASAIILFPAFTSKPFFPLLFSITCLIVGFSARGYLFIRERDTFFSYIPYVRTIQWIHQRVPPSQNVCTDPHAGEILGSFTGRMVHPSFAAIALPKPDADIMAQLETQLEYYDAQVAGSEMMFRFTFGSMRGSVCSQFSLWQDLFQRMGYSEAEFKRFTGCPSDVVRRDEAFIQRYFTSGQKHDDRFRALCPVVVVSQDQKAYWSLPSDYQETKIDERFSVWQVSIPP